MRIIDITSRYNNIKKNLNFFHGSGSHINQIPVKIQEFKSMMIQYIQNLNQQR